jgi:hypothetical protein
MFELELSDTNWDVSYDPSTGIEVIYIDTDEQVSLTLSDLLQMMEQLHG